VKGSSLYFVRDGHCSYDPFSAPLFRCAFHNQLVMQKIDPKDVIVAPYVARLLEYAAKLTQQVLVHLVHLSGN
jgi:hypothetical protein